MGTAHYPDRKAEHTRYPVNSTSGVASMTTQQHPDLLLQAISLLPPEFQQVLLQQPTEYIIGILVGLVTFCLVLFTLCSSPKKRGSLVVIAGPCNSGKTTLFYQLRDGSAHNGTVASMQENTDVVQVKNDKGRPIRQVSILDVPGHERLRYKLDQFLYDAAAVVFVVDSADISPHKVEAAEELFEVLTHPSIARRKVPILIACNKMDLETEAHSVDFVRRQLERQLDSMRKTRTTLSSEAAQKAKVLGKTDVPFTMATVRNSVSTASISAQKGDLQELHAFLASNVK